MTPTLTEVRAALRILAQRKGRPDYELCTVKAVKRALENGTEHHLIAELPFIELEPKEVEKQPKAPIRQVDRSHLRPSNEAFKKLAGWIRRCKLSQAKLAISAGCSKLTISEIANGKAKTCSIETFNKINSVRMSLESITNRDKEQSQ